MVGRGGDEGVEEGDLVSVWEGDLVRFVDVIVVDRLRDDEAVVHPRVSTSRGGRGVGGGQGTVCLTVVTVVLCEVVAVGAAADSGCLEVDGWFLEVMVELGGIVVGPVAFRG